MPTGDAMPLRCPWHHCSVCFCGSMLGLFSFAWQTNASRDLQRVVLSERFDAYALRFDSWSLCFLDSLYYILLFHS